MNNQWSSSLTLAFLSLLLLLSACDPAPKSLPVASVEASSTERKETKVLEAASLVGYDGKEMRNKVNNSLDTNDQHNQQLDQALNNSKSQ